MKRLFMTLILMFAIAMSFATITYGTVTSATIGTDFVRYEGLTTVVVADTAANYIRSPIFTYGSKISGKEGLIVGTVTTSCQHSASSAVVRLRADVYVSADGTNFAIMGTYPAYVSSAATAGTVIVVPLKFITSAPYYTIRWVGGNGTTDYTADIFGAIKTSIIVKP